MIGIYRIRNLINGKFYIGLSRNIARRFIDHRIARGELSVSRAIRKHGVESFAFEIVEECAESQLFEREQFWIAKLKPEYNRNPGGTGNPLPMRADVRARLSLHGKRQWEARTEQERCDFVARNLTGPRKGHLVSPDTRRKLSEALTGRRIPYSVRLKMSASRRVGMRGNQNGNKRVAQLQGGKIIRLFSSVKSAASRIGIHSSGITSVLKRRQRTAGGFNWQLA